MRKGSHRAALRATALLGTSLLLVLGPAPAAQTAPLGGAHAQVAQPLRRGRPLPCRPAQLVANYLGGEGATQQLFGWFVLRDISQVSCSFSDLLMFAGLNASGRVVTTVLHPRLSVGGLILTPRAPMPPRGAGLPRGEVEAALTIVGPECSLLDPTGREHLPWVKPARWLFRLPLGRVLARNTLPSGYSSPTALLATGFKSCKGSIGSLPITAEQ